MKMKIYIFLVMAVIAMACEGDDKYYDFTAEEQELFVYQKGDAFSLYDLNSTDTIQYIVEKADLWYSGSGSVSLQKFYTHYYLSYINSPKHCIEFHSRVLTSYDYNRYSISIHNNGTYFEKLFDGELNDTIYSKDLYGKSYDELYVFSEKKGKKPMLYFTKEEGIVYIDSLPDGSSYSLIEYVKAEEE